jgi:DNA-binding PadR family transcriptional regulator
VNRGALCPAVHGLEQKGLIASDRAVTEDDGRARYDRRTPSGERQFAEEMESWERFPGAVPLVLQPGLQAR